MHVTWKSPPFDHDPILKNEKTGKIVSIKYSDSSSHSCSWTGSKIFPGQDLDPVE